METDGKKVVRERERSRLLVVIPAYNEEMNIRNVMDDLRKCCPEYDYLIINDGSTDGTLEICRKNGYNVLDLPVNLGISGGFQAGMRYALSNGYRYVVQFDGDGQHLARYIRPMYECALQGNYDIVIASRYIRGKKGLSPREIGSRLISLCILLVTGRRITDPTSGMRLYCRGIIEKIATQMNYDPEPDTLAALMRRGATVCEIPARMHDRAHGASYLTFTNSVKYMVYTCTSILVVHWLR